MSAHLNFLFFGAGAIGTYIGGSLLLSGQRVAFVERPEAAAALRQNGMRLRSREITRNIPSPEVYASLGDALQAGPYDVAVLALKSFDTRPALVGFQPHLKDIPPVLCLSNGVDNEPALAEALGAERVVAGTVTSAIGRGQGGEVILEKQRGVGVAAGHTLSESLVTALNAAGLKTRLFARATDMKWSKMLTNLTANATSAILDMTPAEVFAHAGLFRLELAQMNEALQVMRGQGIRVVDLPGTPVRLLALGVQALPPALSQPLLQRGVTGGRGGKMPSFHIDLHAGRGQSEVDYLNGAVVRAGERLKIPTPANRLLRDVLLQLTLGELPLTAFARQPDKLLAAFMQIGQTS